MSAGQLSSAPASTNVWARIRELRQDSIQLLPPRFEKRVREFIKLADGARVQVPITARGEREIALDVRVFETMRVDELSQIYFQQGTSKAQDASGSWHGYGLAIDVISRQFEWFGGKVAIAAWPDPAARRTAGDAWFLAMGRLGEACGMSWGGRWTKFPDLPHLQWAGCPASPSQWHRELQRHRNLQAVYRDVGAA